MEIPFEVIKMLSSKEMRLHHYLWHQTRNSWFHYPKDVQLKLEKLGWKPPRPYRDANDRVIFGNHCGEDFLYMHRQMIVNVNTMLKKVTGNKFAKISGWSELPKPNDPKYPVPPVYEHESLEWLNQIIVETKSDNYFHTKLEYWERTYRDANFLKTISLGDLGCLIESTIHDAMHMRWSKAPNDFRPDPLCEPDLSGNNLCSIDDKWNKPEYDFLADEYSSHVNQIFWKIHGWVDDRISDWMIANKVNVGWHTELVEPNWIGTWTGPNHHHHSNHTDSHHSASEHNLHNMQGAFEVIHKCGIIHHFYSINQNPS